LPAEHRQRARAGAVAFRGAVIQDVIEQFEVLAHQAAFFSSASAASDAAGGDSVGARRDSANRIRPTMIKGSDRICPMVSQSKAMKPSCTSGSRTNSTLKRKTP